MFPLNKLFSRASVKDYFFHNMPKLSLVFFPLVLDLLTRAISLTCRKRIVCDGDTTVLPFGAKDGRGRLYAFWHGRLLFGTFCFRGLGVYAVVSQSKDGEVLARVLSKWGYNHIRGSTSRGWTTVARASLSLLKQGEYIGIAPDGPRGPYRKVNSGLVRIAAAANAMIIPFGCGYSRKITLGSWDRFQIPLPFSRIVIVMGAPFDYHKGSEGELEIQLNRLTDTADRMARG